MTSYNMPSGADYANESANRANRRVSELEVRVATLEMALEQATKIMEMMKETLARLVDLDKHQNRRT